MFDLPVEQWSPAKVQMGELAVELSATVQQACLEFEESPQEQLMLGHLLSTLLPEELRRHVQLATMTSL